MLIKDMGCKINFIDENDNFVGFDDSQCCCESFGWFFTYGKSKTISPDDEINPSDLEGYVFDVGTKPKHDLVFQDDTEANVVAFRLIHPTKGVAWLHFYNSHNGYYFHGWEAHYLKEDGYL